MGSATPRARALLRRVKGAVMGREPGEDALRGRLIAAGASIPPRRPSDVWRAWLNTALRSRADVTRARAELLACGLPPHQDEPKNWDYLIALGLILDRLSPADPILEAGATRYAPLLPWLYLYGYRDLWGIDPVYKRATRAGPIRYDAMDVTAMRFADRSFAALACLSVIEHGVDLDAYLAEAARILRPGGLLFTSTDFWCDGVDTRGQSAYGVPIRIFTSADIAAFVARAERHGFRSLRPLSLVCDEPAVRWDRFGLDYTFVAVALERVAG
jgi:SAM-dependent methyltransferase